jgi:putative restriction endonuclease
MRGLSYYQNCFSTLHTAKSKGFFAPHKPLLLLSVIDLVERGLIHSNRIELNDALVATFKSNAVKYFGNSKVFSPNIGQPFYHLQHEPFWHIAPAASESNIGVAAEPSSSYGRDTIRYSLKYLRANYRYALIDPELFILMQDSRARNKLRATLINKYISTQPSSLLQSSLLPICISLISLIA